MDEILDRIAGIRQHTQGGGRAPHKPLVLLWTLGRLLRGEPRLAPWTELRSATTELLQDFGRPGQKLNPEQPFWRLRSDGIWVVEKEEALAAEVDAAGAPRIGALNELDPLAGFDEATFEALRRSPDLARRAVRQLLDANFPSTLHDDILAAVGVPEDDPAAARSKRRRDPKFREDILRIYEFRCAVCGYDGQLGRRILCLEAAHIRWHTHDGPDEKDNGVALCSFHHKALDTGAIGIDDDLQVMVSQHVRGSERVTPMIHRYNGAPLRGPQPGEPPVRVVYAQWHREEVFQRPPRAPMARPTERDTE